MSLRFPRDFRPATSRRQPDVLGVVPSHNLDAAASTDLPSNLTVSSQQNPSSSMSVSSSGLDLPRARRVAVPMSPPAISFVPGGVVVVAVPLHGVDQTLGRLLLVELLVSGGRAAGARGVSLVDRQAPDCVPSTRWRRPQALSLPATSPNGSRRATPAPRSVASVQALNVMLGEIEESFAARKASEERLRRFLADASHELRTPLTSIRGYAEMFDRGRPRQARGPRDVDAAHTTATQTG